jgi:hypothetical protein
MDDAKIDLIAREVLTSLKKAQAEGERSGAATPVASLRPVVVQLHPSLELLSVPGGVVGSPCIIEPDKPCIGSLKCRSFGH